MTDDYTLEVDNAPAIRFRGEHIAHASSKSPDNESRWTELDLYRTAGGKYICHTVGLTCYQGESDRYAATVCESLDEVRAVFGYGWLAKELYRYAGIDASVEVE